MLNNSLEKNIEIKKKARGTNSFVAPHNNHTYQIDLFFTSTDDIEPKQKFRVGLVCIDVLSKYAVVVPMLVQWKPQISWVRNQKKIYTDDERAIAGEDFKEYVEGENIVLHRTRSHPAFAERMTHL